jgi:hypothetical protein
MLAVFIPSNETTLVTNLAKSVYRKMIAITGFTLAKPPNSESAVRLISFGQTV